MVDENDEEGGYMLRMGDLITINWKDGNEVTGAGLEARGYLDGDDLLEFAKPNSLPENTVFQICVRTRVSAAQELQKYERQMETLPRGDGMGEDTPEEKEQKTMLATLKRVYRKEQAMNNKLFDDEVGSPLKFGAVVQLKAPPWWL